MEIKICKICKLNDTCQKNFDYECKESENYFNKYRNFNILAIYEFFGFLLSSRYECSNIEKSNHIISNINILVNDLDKYWLLKT